MKPRIKSNSRAIPTLALALLLSITASFPLAGCDTDEGPIEEAAEGAEEAAEEVGDAVEDAADEVEDEL